MAHEELKALYEIDRQHSDKPGQYWELKTYNGEWVDAHEPAFVSSIEYRRKPDAPVWPDEKEDARKWRELDKHFEDAEREDHRAFHWKFLDIKYGKAEPQLIQGYTAEQWKTIIDGKFLCEFSYDPISAKVDDVHKPIYSIGTLSVVESDTNSFCRSFGEVTLRYRYCRPLRTKGVRQPWFGGECPVDGDVVIKTRGGQVEFDEEGESMHWDHSGCPGDIIEFIEL